MGVSVVFAKSDGPRRGTEEPGGAGEGELSDRVSRLPWSPSVTAAARARCRRLWAGGLGDGGGDEPERQVCVPVLSTWKEVGARPAFCP